MASAKNISGKAGLEPLPSIVRMPVHSCAWIDCVGVLHFVQDDMDVR